MRAEQNSCLRPTRIFFGALGGLAFLMLFYACNVLPVFAHDIKTVIARKYSSSSNYEKMASELISKNETTIPIDHFGNARVLSTHWFSRVGQKDVILKVQGNTLDYPSLCFVMALEDQSQQDAGCVSMEGSVFYKRPRSNLKFPDLITIVGGRKVLHRWDGNKYQ